MVMTMLLASGLSNVSITATQRPAADGKRIRWCLAVMTASILILRGCLETSSVHVELSV